ncbi:hypothetical protein BDB01DRAFT_52799 [Pilobolus umbonatus]|nr:hypothetical protein BDB01DRAFT_52799 [Pilobolus umbonatus]
MDRDYYKQGIQKRLQEEADREWQQEVNRRRQQELKDEAYAKMLQAQLENEEGNTSTPVVNTPPTSTYRPPIIQTSPIVLTLPRHLPSPTNISPPPLPAKPSAYNSFDSTNHVVRPSYQSNSSPSVNQSTSTIPTSSSSINQSSHNTPSNNRVSHMKTPSNYLYTPNTDQASIPLRHDILFDTPDKSVKSQHASTYQPELNLGLGPSSPITSSSNAFFQTPRFPSAPPLHQSMNDTPRPFWSNSPPHPEVLHMPMPEPENPVYPPSTIYSSDPSPHRMDPSGVFADLSTPPPPTNNTEVYPTMKRSPVPFPLQDQSSYPSFTESAIFSSPHTPKSPPMTRASPTMNKSSVNEPQSSPDTPLMTSMRYSPTSKPSPIKKTEYSDSFLSLKPDEDVKSGRETSDTPREEKVEHTPLYLSDDDQWDRDDDQWDRDDEKPRYVSPLVDDDSDSEDNYSDMVIVRGDREIEKKIDKEVAVSEKSVNPFADAFTIAVNKVTTKEDSRPFEQKTQCPDASNPVVSAGYTEKESLEVELPSAFQVMTSPRAETPGLPVGYPFHSAEHIYPSSYDNTYTPVFPKKILRAGAPPILSANQNNPFIKQMTENEATRNKSLPTVPDQCKKKNTS